MRNTRVALITAGLVGVVCALACGAPAPVDNNRHIFVRVENHYADSLFSVSYSVDLPDGGNLAATVLSNERIEGGRSVREPAFPAPDGSKVTWTFSATSLGERKTFSPFQTVVDGGTNETYEFVYDYDFATANFAVEHGWTIY